MAKLRDEKPQAELSQEFDVYPNLISDWRNQLLEQAASVQNRVDRDLEALHAKIGRQALEIDFFYPPSSKAGKAERKAMIARPHILAVPPAKPNCWGSAEGAFTTCFDRFRTLTRG